jgi:nucleoside-diphosphate-sugar epimerase
MTQSLQGRRVALIGGAGFIGHHLALRLRREGAHVEIIDGLQVNNLVALTANTDKLPNRDLYLYLIQERLRLLQDAGIPLHVLDARDYHALSHTLNAIDPQVVFHLAAVAHAGWANKNPYTTFDHSLRTLENALDCARDNVEHFVYFSSSMVYGNFAGESVTEETPCEPLGIYGALKFAGEKLVIAYNQVFDLPYTIIRPSALYGERCISRRVIQVFLENAFMGKPVKMTGEGSSKLDFTHVEDLTAGLAAVIAHEGSRNEIFNLTFGDARSIADVVDLLQRRFPDVEVLREEANRLMPERGTLSVDKARDMLGYAPVMTLEQGFDQYATWYEKLFDESPELLRSP